MALSENMAARCVMDHGASDGPTRGGTLAKRMGTRSPKEKGVIPAAKQMKPQKSGGSSVDSLIHAERGKKKKKKEMLPGAAAFNKNKRGRPDSHSH